MAGAYYNKGAAVEYTRCDITVSYDSNGYSKYRMEVNAGRAITASIAVAPQLHRMTTTEFRTFFGIKDVAEMRRTIERYGGKQVGRSHMAMEFDEIEDAKRFIDNVIAPKILMGQLAK